MSKRIKISMTKEYINKMVMEVLNEADFKTASPSGPRNMQDKIDRVPKGNECPGGAKCAYLIVSSKGVPIHVFSSEMEAKIMVQSFNMELPDYARVSQAVKIISIPFNMPSEKEDKFVAGGILHENWNKFLETDEVKKPKSIFHTSSWKGGEAIVKSKSLDPSFGKGDFVSCSSVIKFGGDISGKDIAIEMEVPKNMERVKYNKTWYGKNQEKGIYVAGPKYAEVSPSDGRILKSFLSKSDEQEYISSVSDEVVKIKPLRIWVPDEKSKKRVESLKLGIEVEIPPKIIK